MIIFNGAALEDIAPIMVEDIRVSPIELNVTAAQRPIRWGADFVRVTGGTRTVTITFAVIKNDLAVRQQYLKQVTKWARSAAPGRLQIPGHDGVYIECVCTELPEPSLRQWWEGKLRLVFTAFDNPYFTATMEKTADCGNDPFTVGGDAPPLMRITNTFAATTSDPAWSDGTDTVGFTSIGAGDFVLDLNRQTAALDGVSVMGAYKYLTSSFIITHTGEMTITGSGTVHYRERWE